MEKPIRLMHIVLSLNIGGLENLVLKLLTKINRLKYTPIICSLTEHGDLEQEFIDIGIPVYVVKKREGIDYTLPIRLGKLFRQQKINIIHTHNVTPYLYGTFGAKLARVPVVLHTEHSNLFPEQKKLMLAERYLSGISNLIIADSEKVANFLIHHQAISPKKVTTILNGIDIDSYNVNVDKTRKIKELGLDPHDLIIGNVARLVPVKDHHTMLMSFKEICRAINNARLVIVGDGQLRVDLENLSSKLGLSENVTFLGSRRDIPELMSIFDVFVLSSISEGLSLTLLEAMAARKAIVATDVGGNPEVVEDKVTGLIVPAQNPSALSEALIYLLRNKDERIKMGEFGRKRVEQYFSLDVMVKNYENVYQAALNRKKGLL